MYIGRTFSIDDDLEVMMSSIKLTQLTKASGCAAKLGPGTLEKVLRSLPEFKKDDNLLVGFSTSDDAAVYKITDDTAMVQTIDFFTPVVDDPYTFGQIAAANALSDIYAMGGVPKIALNVVGFPITLMPSVLADIMAGGADKVREADAVMAGGHSIQNDDPLYGLSVSGFVHPERILRNWGAKPGDILILTKQIGCGIINTAVKAEMASTEAQNEAITVMSSLNRKASEIITRYPVHACTDVTGFGLIGHSLEMAGPSEITIALHSSDIPFITDAAEYAETGLVPAGSYRNRKHQGDRVDDLQTDETIKDLLYDPQTSGGLLFAVNKTYQDEMMKELSVLPTKCAVIGEVVSKKDKAIIIRP